MLHGCSGFGSSFRAEITRRYGSADVLTHPMIEVIESLPSATVGFAFRGQVSDAELQRCVVPTIESRLLDVERIKALLVFESSFQHFGLAAALDDAVLGLRHWEGFERIAVVTDQPLIRHSTKVMALLLPCPVRMFRLEQQDEARRWLSESLGTIHLERAGDVITITLIGLLDSQTFARIETDLSRLFAAGERPRVLVDLRQFDGWLALTALREHLRLIHTYRQQPSRIAVVTGELWQQLAHRLVRGFGEPKVEVFPSGRMLEAQEWICQD